MMMSDIIVVQPPGEIERNHASDRNVLSASLAKQTFREFFRNFRIGNLYIYRDALIRQFNRGEYFIEVDLAHVNEFDDQLLNNLQTNPTDFIPYFEAGAKEALSKFLLKPDTEGINNITNNWQIMFKSSQLPQSIRNLTAEHVNKLIKVPGIVIACSNSRARATKIQLRCKGICGRNKTILNKLPFTYVAIPTKCDNSENVEDKCTDGEYVILAQKCEYIDEQTIKLQESPEEVPTGEMPRTISIIIERYLVDRIAAGTRVSIIGICSLHNGTAKNGKSNKLSYIQAVGIQVDEFGGGRTNSLALSPQEEEEMTKLSRDPDIYEKISRSIAPQISGDYTVDIKKALACLLMSGSRKVLADGVKLRGDINVLLMGDPSTAKSQFLKYITKVAPIGVYTSGKGSSAAGLTASINKNSNGEFVMEGGAMVLADGGIICIDEFDKMREIDRVAIHEAMEQQTISIAKAGINTVLNSRASVLAAANPIFGRYDDLKGVGDNIDLMTTILSRFDCIFIVRDIRDTEKDRSIARHVLGIHINSSLVDTAREGDIDVATLKKYVSYCRERCAPRLSEEAAILLSGQYVHIRNRVRESLKDTPGESQVVPITIRQLEALVRLSESLAKMRLSAEATVADVEEALRLFKVSTLAASQSNPALLSGSSGAAITEEVKRSEEFLKRRLGIRMTVNSKKILEESLVQGYSDESMKRAIMAMVLKGELQELNSKKLLRRVR